MSYAEHLALQQRVGDTYDRLTHESLTEVVEYVRNHKEKKAMNDQQIEATARATHEANRAWCLAHGDASQPAWDDAPEWQRNSAINGVKGVLAGNGPEQSHESWLKEKTETGWKYGPVKDPEKKEHPCFVPYAELPPEQKAKDHVFVGVSKAFIAAFGS